MSTLAFHLFRGLDWSLSLIYTYGFVPLIATVLTTSLPPIFREKERIWEGQSKHFSS